MFIHLLFQKIFNLEDLILVRLKAMQLELEVPEVPEGYGLVCAASGQYELGVGIEAKAVYLTQKIFIFNYISLCRKNLCGVRVNSVAWSVGCCAPCVPDAQLLVICH